MLETAVCKLPNRVRSQMCWATANSICTHSKTSELVPALQTAAKPHCFTAMHVCRCQCPDRHPLHVSPLSCTTQGLCHTLDAQVLNHCQLSSSCLAVQAMYNVTAVCKAWRRVGLYCFFRNLSASLPQVAHALQLFRLVSSQLLCAVVSLHMSSDRI